MNKKQLAKKLASHRFTVISEGNGSSDNDVLEFKAKQKQAQQRAKRRQSSAKPTLASKLEGFKVTAKSA
jgi:hypothetical protein